MPLDVLSDGFVKICIDPSLNFFAGRCRMLIEGQYVVNGALATPIIPDTVIPVNSERYVDDMFTEGSVLAESIKTALQMCSSNIELYVIPRQDAAGATAAEYTMTITGPATTDGRIDIFMGNRQYQVTGVRVSAGDDAATIAAAIASEIPSALPYTVTQGTNAGVDDHVLTFVARNAGTVGNYFNPVLNWRGFQNYYPAGVGITVARTVTGAGDPAPLNYLEVLGDCCYDVYALLSEDLDWQDALKDWINSAWDCSKPQCFGHGYVYNSGTLGQVLATFDNSPELSRLAVPLNDVNYPWQMIAAYAAKTACTACVNPELSIQGRNYGLLFAVYRPTSCSLPWAYADMAQLQQQGFVTFGPGTQGAATLTNPYIQNDITNYLYDELNRPNTTYRDAAQRRQTKKTAVSLAEELQTNNGLALFTTSTRVPQGTFGTNKRMIQARLKNWARANVGILFSDFDNFEQQLVIREDFEVAQPCSGVPCRLHIDFQYRPPCRIAEFRVNAQPKILDNCPR